VGKGEEACGPGALPRALPPPAVGWDGAQLGVCVGGRGRMRRRRTGQ